MAELRVRLQFDYPPPAGPESRHMWMLLNPEHLRTVTDLSDLIRGRYYPHQRGALYLYVQDCLLPPGESARLIRDNDVIRVQWNGHDPEDDDLDSESQAPPSKKRTWQRCEEEAEESPTVIPKKRKPDPHGTETHRSRKEKVILKEREQDESSDSSRKKAKKKRVPEAEAEAADPEESSEKKKGQKHSEISTSLKAANKILSLLRSNQESPTKRVRASSGTSSHKKPSTSHQETPEISIQPITTIPLNSPSPMTLRLYAALSGKKKSGISVKDIGTISVNKPSEISHKPIITFSGKKPSNKSARPTTILSGKKTNNELPARTARQTSSSASERSSDQESSTKGKKPPKGLSKAGSTISINKAKLNNKPPAMSETVTSSDSSASSSDHESPNIGKNCSKVQSIATATINKTNPIHKNLGERARSNIDYSASSYDQELSMARKNPSVATSKPSNPVSDKTVFSSEMRKMKESPASDNGDTINRRFMDAVTTPPVNGISEEPHKEILSLGTDSDTCIIQKQGPVQHLTCGVPSRVSNGHEPNGIQQEHVSNPGLYGRGRGRGTDFFPWRGQGGHRFGGRGDRGKGRAYGSQFFHNYGSSALKKQQLEEPATNISMVIQNPAERLNKDYSAFPLLAAPPQLGKVIAFKILELNENYSPELSDYKEGIVRSFDSVTQQIEVELLSRQKKREPGKFDLVYESEDGKEMVEYAVLSDRKIVEPWSSLITPRLVMEKGSAEGTTPQPL